MAKDENGDGAPDTHGNHQGGDRDWDTEGEELRD